MSEKGMICDVVMDLLPLYIENACSEESNNLVQEHVSHCRMCQNCMKELKETGEISPEQQKKIVRRKVRQEMYGIFSDVLGRISRVVRFVPLIMYIAVIVFLIQMEFFGIDYPHLRFDNWRAWLLLGLYDLIIPGTFLIFCFLKGRKMWKSVATILASVVCSWYLILMGIVGMLGAGMVISNYTQDVTLYREVLDLRFQDGEFAIFPEIIPKEVSDVEFTYEQINDWDQDYCIELRFRFLDREDFEAETERLNTSVYKRNMYEETKENEIHFARHHGSHEAACYFDKDTMEMYYVVRKGEF